MKIGTTPCNEETYRAHVRQSQDRGELANFFAHLRELVRVEHGGLTDEADATVRQRHVIGFGQSALLLQYLIEMLTNGRVGTIGADKDVAMEEGVVRCVNLDLVVNLLEGQDSLTQEDTLPGNMVPQDVIQVRPSNNILFVTSTK